MKLWIEQILTYIDCSDKGCFQKTFFERVFWATPTPDDDCAWTRGCKPYLIFFSSCDWRNASEKLDEGKSIFRRWTLQYSTLFGSSVTKMSDDLTQQVVEKWQNVVMQGRIDHLRNSIVDQHCLDCASSIDYEREKQNLISRQSKCLPQYAKLTLKLAAENEKIFYNLSADCYRKKVRIDFSFLSQMNSA
jgi:hypothetical protein